MLNSGFVLFFAECCDFDESRVFSGFSAAGEDSDVAGFLSFVLAFRVVCIDEFTPPSCEVGRVIPLAKSGAVIVVVVEDDTAVFLHFRIVGDLHDDVLVNDGVLVVVPYDDAEDFLDFAQVNLDPREFFGHHFDVVLLVALLVSIGDLAQFSGEWFFVTEATSDWLVECQVDESFRNHEVVSLVKCS